MKYFIKNLGIIICAFYSICKLEKHNRNRKNIVKTIIFSIVISMLSILIDKVVAYLTMPLLFYIFYIYSFQNAMCSKRIHFINSIVAFALSYVLFGMSVMVACLVILPFPIELSVKYNQIVCFVIHLIFTYIIFHINRVKSGMPFLTKKIYSFPGMVISLCVLIISGFLNAKEYLNHYRVHFFILVIVLLILAVLIFLYWRNSITKSYLERLNLRNIDALNAELQEKNAYIAKLEADNDRLGRIVHRDNKQVPAMERAVEKYVNGLLYYAKVMNIDSLMQTEQARLAVTAEGYVPDYSMEVADSLIDNVDEILAGRGSEDKKAPLLRFLLDGKALMEELKQMASERDDIVYEAERRKKELPRCGVGRVDHLLEYMQEEAEKDHISLKVVYDCNVKDMVDVCLNEEQMCTLLGDLVQNAIIATRYNHGKELLIRIGMVGKVYAIHVFDSGIPFTKEVLVKYGMEQITTHADDSGSGIGLMQTYDTLNACGASIFIDEFDGASGLYTKKVSVVFNRKHQYILYTNRGDEEMAYLKKRADLTVVKK